jgi:hypothetical protein
MDCDDLFGRTRDPAGDGDTTALALAVLCSIAPAEERYFDPSSIS